MAENNPHRPYRLALSYAGGKYDLRIQAHETDPNLLVLKSINPEAVPNLILATGVNPEVTTAFKGKKYHVTFATKKGVAELVAAAITTVATKVEAATMQALDVLDAEDDEEEDEGDFSADD
jgi:hypothetical protein